jgi:hypothetical protein
MLRAALNFKNYNPRDAHIKLLFIKFSHSINTDNYLFEIYTEIYISTHINTKFLYIYIRLK